MTCSDVLGWSSKGRPGQAKHKTVLGTGALLTLTCLVFLASEAYEEPQTGRQTLTKKHTHYVHLYIKIICLSYTFQGIVKK